MMNRLNGRRVCAAIGRTLFATALCASLPTTARGEILSNDLANASGGVESATGSDWLASSFGTGTSVTHLQTATLLIASSGGSAQVDVYNDGLLSPGSLVGTLTAAEPLSSSLAETTFTGDVVLDPDSTYWIVLQAPSGSVDWSWTTDNSGTGAGFLHTFATSGDAGGTWFSYDVFPLQFSVDATAVPEPATIGMIALACLTLRRRRPA